MNQELLFDEQTGGSLPALGVVSAWFGALVIGVTAVAHVARTDKTALPLVDSLRMILFAFVLASLIYLAAQGRRGVGTAILPLFINFSTFIIISFVPFGALWQELQFQWRWQAYNQVVDLVGSGAIQPDAAGVITLPWQYDQLSSSGEALVTQAGEVTRILFFTHRSSPHSYTGYLYSSDNRPPATGDFGGRWQTLVQKRPYWFYCAAE